MHKIDNYYCLIRLILPKNIAVYMFQENHIRINYPICFTAYSANALYKLMCVYKGIKYLSIYHYLYLGQEIYKAEQTLFLGQQYIQD